MQASHSSNLTANRPTANGLANVTMCCGRSSAVLPTSLSGDPMTNLPAGTTTISGQVLHSLKWSIGRRASSSMCDKGVGRRTLGKLPSRAARSGEMSSKRGLLICLRQS